MIETLFGNEYLLALLGLLGMLGLLAMSTLFKALSSRTRTTISIISSIVVIASIFRITALNSQIAQGLTAVGTLALALVAYLTISKNARQTNEVIRANRKDQINTRKGELVDELLKWINDILKETYDSTTMKNGWDMMEKFNDKQAVTTGFSDVLDLRTYKARDEELMNLSALLSNKEYMLNIAKYFKYDVTLARFIKSTVAYKDMLIAMRDKRLKSGKKAGTKGEKILSELLGAGITLVRLEGVASLTGLSQIKLNILYD